jgi:hypothetical protein
MSDALRQKAEANQARFARIVSACLPFADAATTELPLGRLLRLSLLTSTDTLVRLWVMPMRLPCKITRSKNAHGCDVH